MLHEWNTKFADNKAKQLCFQRLVCSKVIDLFNCISFVLCLQRWIAPALGVGVGAKHSCQIYKIWDNIYFTEGDFFLLELRDLIFSKSVRYWWILVATRGNVWSDIF